MPISRQPKGSSKGGQFKPADAPDAPPDDGLTLSQPLDPATPVAQMTPIPTSRLRDLIETGRARPPRRKIEDLPPPEPGPSLTTALLAMRDEECY